MSIAPLPLLFLSKFTLSIYHIINIYNHNVTFVILLTLSLSIHENYIMKRVINHIQSS